MTTAQTTTQEERDPQDRNGNNQPGYVVKIRHGFGKKASYERIGVAWLNEDGSLYVKLYGTQVISQGFTLYALAESDKTGA